MEKIAFIGLGNMGLPMAANLVKAGYDVCGFDLSTKAQANAAKRSINVATSLASCAKGANILITMLPMGEHVLNIINQVKDFLTSGATIIDCSTIDIESCNKLHQLALEGGFTSIDAPVSGGVGGAEGASLTFMVGAHAPDFTRIQPILSAMGRNIIHCGAAASGQAAKICNNMILGISMIAVSEAFILGEKLGLSHQALFDVASTSSGQCWSLTSYCPVPGPVPTAPSNRNYTPGFAAPLMRKDLGLAAQAANSVDLDVPLGLHAYELYSQYLSEGGENRDFSAIIEWLRTRNA